MLQRCISSIVCPVCRASFDIEGRSAVCSNRHTFDLARSGYLNLLPSRRKLPETVGDTQEMLVARKRFLGGGYFDPLVRAVKDIVRELETITRSETGHVVEVGSGTGHYLAALKDELGGERCYFGVDISKAAARIGAGLHKDMMFLVADVRAAIPLKSEGASVVLNVFAPRNAQEFARVLRPDGHAIVVIPAPDHLGELVSRFGLLQVHGDKEEILLKDFEGSLHLTHRATVRYEMSLPAQAVRDAVSMGPSARHLSEDTRLALDATPDLACTASFVVLVFRREPAPISCPHGEMDL